MRVPRPTRIDFAIPMACAAWAGAALAGERSAALVVVPLVFLALLPVRHLPPASAAAIAALAVLLDALGISEENPAIIAAALTACYALGRHARPRFDLAAWTILVAALAGAGGFAVADIVFVSVLTGATFAAGRFVRRRSHAAHLAAGEAASLAARDPEALAADVVAGERTRLAGAVLEVIRASVGKMRGAAASAEHGLDRAALVSIEDEGRLAVAELRRLLGLLRAEPAPQAALEPRAGRPASPWRFDLAAAIALSALASAEAVLDDAAPLAAVLTVSLVAAVALRRAAPGAACLGGTVVLGLALLLDAPVVTGFAAGAAYALLAWSIGARRRTRDHAALAVLASAATVEANVHAPGNEAILIGLIAVAALTGHAWAERDSAGRTAEARADALRAEHEAVVERAVRAERLRLAREVHDVASHAVGVMVLQAGAALALRERDPEAARAAVRAVQTAGAEATHELDVLFGVLAVGADEAAGVAAPGTSEELIAAVEALVARMRSGGLDVSFDASKCAPVPAALTGTTFRIVQEALTNAARHAPGSRVRVQITSGDSAVAVTVRDDGPGSDSHDAGFGLVGLSERVRAIGGELSAGPAAHGGFAVEARLPIPVHQEAPA